MILNLLIVVLGLAVVIGLHEASHMFVSKLFGVKVLKFSLGFGPVLFSKKLAGTIYALSLLPLGGYVQCKGEDPQSNVKNGFFSLPWYKRSLIALAGPVANFLLGFVMIFGILVLFKGWPVMEGLQRAYTITSDIIMITLKWVYGFIHPVQTVGLTMAPSHATDLSGPIMVTKVLLSSIKDGAAQFLFILAIISLSLGLFNLFPLPMLDGGHIFLYTLEGLRGRKFSNIVYTTWNVIGLILMVMLMAFACFQDISRLIK